MKAIGAGGRGELRARARLAGPVWVFALLDDYSFLATALAAALLD